MKFVWRNLWMAPKMLKAANTYDCMIATADSRMSSGIYVMIKIIRRDIDRNGPVFHSKVISKCPPIIFDANTAGRLIFLIVSIKLDWEVADLIKKVDIIRFDRA